MKENVRERERRKSKKVCVQRLKNRSRRPGREKEQ